MLRPERRRQPRDSLRGAGESDPINTVLDGVCRANAPQELGSVFGIFTPGFYPPMLE